jgi:hypothetical protein
MCEPMALGVGLRRKNLRRHWTAGGPCLREGLHPRLINLDRDRSLQKRYRQYESLMASEAQQNSLHATKRAMLNSHLMSNLYERPRLSGQS